MAVAIIQSLLWSCFQVVLDGFTVALQALLPAPVLSEVATQQPLLEVLPSQNPSTVDPADHSNPEPSSSSDASSGAGNTVVNGEATGGSSQINNMLGSSGQGTEVPPSSATGEPKKKFTAAPLESFELTEEAERRLLAEEDGRRKVHTKRRGRIRELEETRSELAEKELTLLLKETELLEKEQTLVVLREEVRHLAAV